jgi:hypothetical protein
MVKLYLYRIRVEGSESNLYPELYEGKEDFATTHMSSEGIKGLARVVNSTARGATFNRDTTSKVIFNIREHAPAILMALSDTLPIHPKQKKEFQKYLLGYVGVNWIDERKDPSFIGLLDYYKTARS